MVFLEDQIARCRANGDDPDAESVDLYARLGNAQRRHIEAIGWTSSVRETVKADRDIRKTAKTILSILEEADLLESAEYATKAVD